MIFNLFIPEFYMKHVTDEFYPLTFAFESLVNLLLNVKENFFTFVV